MQKWRGNIGREMETLKTNQQEMLEIKTTVREMKKALGRFILRLDMASERISELEAMLVELARLKSTEENDKDATE